MNIFDRLLRRSKKSNRPAFLSADREDAYIYFLNKTEENDAISMTYVRKSWEEELPYPCFTETEFEMVEKIKNGDNALVDDLVNSYRTRSVDEKAIFPDENKAIYWDWFLKKTKNK